MVFLCIVAYARDLLINLSSSDKYLDIGTLNWQDSVMVPRTSNNFKFFFYDYFIYELLMTQNFLYRVYGERLGKIVV